MKYKPNVIAKRYGIELTELLKAIECGIFELDNRGCLSLDVHLYSYIKRYNQVYHDLPKTAILKVNEIGGAIYDDNGNYYAIKPDYTWMSTTDFMMANRFITIKEEQIIPKATTIEFNQTEILFLLNHPLINKHYGIKEKLNKALAKTL